MQTKKELMTTEGKKKLEDELHDLKTNKRTENSEKLKEARMQGDLSENAEYDAAKDEQAHIEARILEIENILKNAEVVVYEDADKSKINLGSTVKILDMEFKEGKISIESPLGIALMKKVKGDVISVEAPVGVIKYKILDFEN